MTRQLAAGPLRACLHYSAAEIAFLRRHWPGNELEAHEIAAALDRTTEGVRSKALDLGLSRGEVIRSQVAQRCGALGGRGNTREKRQREAAP